jgi:hypothetical protein
MRWFHGVALGILTACLTVGVIRFLQFIPAALHYPFELDYGEGIVLQQMRNMLAGIGYSPISAYPAVVYHYPPVYHMTVAAFALTTDMDQMIAGRVVALLATLGSAAAAGMLVASVLRGHAGARTRTICGLLAALVLLNCYAVQLWAPLMRVDMLALLFELTGMILAIRAIEQPRWIHGAALIFVAAVYTKQTSIAAPVATFAVLLAVRPRLALRGIATMAGVGIALLAALDWATAGGFLQHILLYNINRLNPPGLLLPAILLLNHLMLAILAGIGAVNTARRLVPPGTRLRAFRARASGNPALAGCAILLAYFAISTPMLASMMKVGANTNYFIGWSCAMALFCGIGLHPVVASVVGDGSRTAQLTVSILMLFLVAIGIPIQSMTLPNRNQDVPEMKRREGRYWSVASRIRASSKPVIADPMTLLIRAGRNVEWEPAIAAELAHTGVYDEAGFVRMIRAHRFGFFVMQGKPSDRIYRERYNPAVLAAIEAAYPVRQPLGNLVLHYPGPRMPPVAH